MAPIDGGTQLAEQPRRGNVSAEGERAAVNLPALSTPRQISASRPTTRGVQARHDQQDFDDFQTCFAAVDAEVGRCPSASSKPASAATPRRPLPPLPTAAEQDNAEEPDAGNWTPVAPPSRSTQSSFRSRRGTRMKARTPSCGIAPTRHETKRAYNGIDPDVLLDLDTRVQQMIQEAEQVPVSDATGVYLLVERCHSCDAHHKLTTRHVEEQYSTGVQQLLEEVRNSLDVSVMGYGELLCRLDATPRRLGNAYAHGKEIWHGASRVGALEVYLLTPSLDFLPAGSVGSFGPRKTAGCEARPHSKSTWGAKALLPESGYTVTLLHSKLCSQSWPTVDQILKRTFLALPRALVCVHVMCPSGQPLPSFTVEVRPTRERRDAEMGTDGQECGNNQEELNTCDDAQQLVVEGINGACHIEGLPLQAMVELRVHHSTMQEQSVEFIVSRLRVQFSFGADIVFRLWTIEVPGGISINASVDDLPAVRLPANAKPFVGVITTTDGAHQKVCGRIQLPWLDFHPSHSGCVFPFAALRRFHVEGYHDEDLLPGIENCTAQHLHQHVFLEIAHLDAPEVALQIVLPGSRRPVAEVDVGVPAEAPHTRTDVAGDCRLVLRPGRHALRLRHAWLTGDWVEQSIHVDGLQPSLQVPLPIRANIFAAPLQIRRQTKVVDVWLTPAGAVAPDGWQPFSGHLQADGDTRMEVKDGLLAPEVCQADILDNAAQLRPHSPDPFARLSLVPPFSRRFEEESQPTAMPVIGGTERLLEILSSGPLHLGTLGQGRPAAALQARGGVTAASTQAGRRTRGILVRSMTACCGHGVANIDVDVDDGALQGSTGSDGWWEAHGVSTGPHVVKASHLALGGSIRSIVCMSSGRTDAEQCAELPILFEAQVFLFSVPGTKGRRVVQVAGSRCQLPAEAEAVACKVVNEHGEEMCPPLSGGKVLEPVEFQVSALQADALCPVLAMTVLPEAANHQWFPLQQLPFDGGPCGLRTLLSAGPVTLGSLKPYATAVYVNGRSISVPLEEFATAGELAAQVKQVIGLEMEGTFSFADENAVEEALPHDTLIHMGQRLQALAQMEIVVTFGKTDLGLEGANVSIEGCSRAMAKKTSASGRCEVLLPGGLHRLTATHPVLGTSVHAEVDVRKLHCIQNISARAQVLLFIHPATASSASASPLTVWLAASRAQVSREARPVSASVKVRKLPVGADVGYWEANVGGDVISAISLEDDSGSLTAGVGRMPATGISVTCTMDNHIWFPLATWHLEEVSAWQELLKGPVQVGVLKPSVVVRCHGFGNPHRTLRLPAETHKKASAICRAAAFQLDVPEASLALFREELQLDGNDAVRAFSVLDLWLMAQLEVRVMTRCCLSGRFKGIEGAVIRVTEDYSMDGQPTLVSDAKHLLKPGTKVLDSIGRPAAVVRSCSRSGLCEVKYADGSHVEVLTSSVLVQDPRQGGTTDSTGRCMVATNTGAHMVQVQHPLLRRSAVQAPHSEQVDSKSKESLVWGRRAELVKDGITETFIVDSQLFIFELPEEEQLLGSDSVGEGRGKTFVKRVWAAAHREDLPETARALPGTLQLLRRGGDKLPAAMQRDIEKPVQLPQVGNIVPGQKELPTDIVGVAVEAEGEEGLVWCPEGVCTLAGGASLGHELLVAGSLQLGLLKPGIFIFCDEIPAGPREPLHVAVDVGTTASDIIDVVLQELQASSSTVGLFMLDGHRFSGHIAVSKDMRLWARPLVPLKIRVLVPEGDSGPHGLPDAVVKVDGDACGSTDACGSVEVFVRLGSRTVFLEHVCFGSAGRSLGELNVTAAEKEHVVLADVRLYVSATKADDEPVSTSEAVLVWISSNKDHVQGVPVEVTGIVRFKDVHGNDMHKELQQGGITEVDLVQGAKLQGEMGANCHLRCDLASLQVEAHRIGYQWRPRDPSPLVERAAEIGGSEFLRLLACPCVLGYLDPIIEVHFCSGEREPFPIPLGDVVTVGNVKDVLATALEVDEELLIVHSCGRVLADADDISWGMEVEVDEAEHVNISVVTGCCGVALEGVLVYVDDVCCGTTDQDGQVISVVMTAGEHEVAFEHAAFGSSGRAVHMAHIDRGIDNDFMVVLNLNFTIYTSDPGEDEAGSGVGLGIEPSMVWLATDSAQVADNVCAVQGRVSCDMTDGKKLTAVLGSSVVAPLALRVAVDPQAHSLRRKKCLLGSLRLQCQRRGFRWSPKEPSPIAQRLEDIGGCEFLRVLACPVVMGLLKPAVLVQCANGQLLTMALEDYGDVQALRSYVAEELGAEEEADTMLLEAVEGTVLPDGKLVPGVNGMRFIAALSGETLADARDALRLHEATEWEEIQEADTASAKDSHRQQGAGCFQVIRTDIPTLTEISGRFQPIPGL